MQSYIDSLTTSQLVRFYWRVWEKMTAGYGFQPFGYDPRMLREFHPQMMRCLDYIRSSYLLRGM